MNKTALHWAAKNDAKEVAEQLISAGAKMNKKDINK